MFEHLHKWANHSPQIQSVFLINTKGDAWIGSPVGPPPAGGGVQCFVEQVVSLDPNPKTLNCESNSIFFCSLLKNFLLYVALPADTVQLFILVPFHS